VQCVEKMGILSLGALRDSANFPAYSLAAANFATRREMSGRRLQKGAV
jgi:hypothetical protein